MIPGDWRAAWCDNRSWHSTHWADATPLSWLTSADRTTSTTARAPAAASVECCWILAVIGVKQSTALSRHYQRNRRCRCRHLSRLHMFSFYRAYIPNEHERTWFLSDVCWSFKFIRQVVLQQTTYHYCKRSSLPSSAEIDAAVSDISRCLSGSTAHDALTWWLTPDPQWKPP